MTLSTDIVLPFRPAQFLSENPSEREEYQREFIHSLTEMYQDLARTINGTIKSFTPVIKGTTAAGTGTYARQVGWVRRQGIFVDAFFDVQWTAHSGAGALYIELPYKTKNTDGAPWIGVIQPSSLGFGAGKTYLTINGISDTFRGEIWANGTGVTTSALSIASPGRLQGHLSYLGQEFS